mgnify:CR=1 FL=1
MIHELARFDHARLVFGGFLAFMDATGFAYVAAAVVLTAAMCALERSEPHLMQQIAQDIENVRIGRYQTRQQYRQGVVTAANKLRLPEHERAALYGAL